jgi:phage terminase large subunit GpA-like protein
VSEKPIRVYFKGVAKRVWTKIGGARNEPLDARVLAMAALEGLRSTGLKLDKEHAALQRARQSGPATEVIRSQWMAR